MARNLQEIPITRVFSQSRIKRVFITKKSVEKRLSNNKRKSKKGNKNTLAYVIATAE